MTSSIKQKLDEGQLVRLLGIGLLADPRLVELAGQSNWVDGIWLDQEHGAMSHERMELVLLACRAAGLDAFARIAPTDYATIMRPMEAGASGIMAAQIQNHEHARQIVQWAKYPPAGVRGLNLTNYEGNYGAADMAEHVQRSNRDRWLAIQIETVGGLNDVETIAALEGVDCLFVGPADLSSSLGVPGQVLHPKCIAALERVAAAAKASSRPWGVVPRNPEHADKCRELGCQMFSLASDLLVVRRGFEAIATTYRQFMGA